MSTNEDEIIKKRLLVEGDSGNEDRCINKLAKLFIKYVKSIQNDKTQPQIEDEETENAYEMMLAVLSHIEFGLFRNQLVLDMNKLEQENYEHLYQNIDYEIEKAKLNIIKSKSDLQEARKIRKNRQEYDVIAKEINKFPDRHEMQLSVERLEKQLENLKQTKNDLNHKIELRRKQFSVLVKSVSTLKCLIENDQYNDIVIDDSNDIICNTVTDNANNSSFTIDDSNKMDLSLIEVDSKNNDTADDDTDDNYKKIN